MEFQSRGGALRVLPFEEWLSRYERDVPDDRNSAYKMAVNRLKNLYSWQFEGPHIGHDISPGWFLLVARACDEVNRLAEAGELDRHEFYWAQIKEKFGGLRLYPRMKNAEPPHPKLLALIAELQGESVSACEICGTPAKLTRDEHGWFATHCEFHASQKRARGASWTWPGL